MKIVGPLFEDLKSPDAEVRNSALTKIEALTWDGETVEILRGKTISEFPKDILPFIFKLYRLHGTVEDIPMIEKFIEHENPRVLVAAVEAIEKIKPEDLKNFIVPLLVNSNPGIRSTAIRLLYRWDPVEALNHFMPMLNGEDPGEKELALSLAYFFPFHEVGTHLLRFMALEEDLDLLKKAGNLFQINPHPEIPRKLVEIAETSSGGKRNLIGTVLEGVVQALSRAGLVKKAPGEILTDLKEAYRQKKVQNLLEQCALAIQSEDWQQRLAVVGRLDLLLQNGIDGAMEILQSHFPRENDQFVREQISGLLGKKADKPAEASPSGRFAGYGTPGRPPVEETDPEKLGQAERLSWLRSMDPERFKEHKSLIQRLSQTGSQEERVSSITALGTFGNETDLGDIRKNLLNGSSSEIIAGLEVLKNRSPEVLLPMLPKLLEHSSNDVKEAAVRAYILVDKKQAIILVIQMLGSVAVSQRGGGIFAAGFFDFLSVKGILLNLLAREDSEDNVRQVCILFRANLSDEVLREVIEIAGNGTAPQGKFLQKWLEGAVGAYLQENPGKYENPEKFMEWALSCIKARKEQEAAPSPAYSLKNIQKLRQDRKTPIKEPEKKITEPGLWEVIPFSQKIAFIGLTSFIFIICWLFDVGKQSSPEKKSKQTNSVGSTSLIPSKLQEGEVREIHGNILGVRGNGVLVFLDETREKVFIQYPVPPQNLKKDDKIRARIKVEKKQADEILANLLRLY